MDEIKKILVGLENDFGCKILRNKENNIKDDIDIEIFNNNFLEIREYLLNSHFSLYNEKNGKIHFYKFINNNLIHLDFILNDNYIKKYFKLNSNISLLSDNLESRFIRYLFLLRKEKLNFIYENKLELIKNNFFIDSINGNIFSRKISFDIIVNIFQRKTITLFFNLKYKYFLGYLIGRFKEYLSVLNTGKSIVFLGPDGVGKTTIITTLYSNLGGNKIYMGGREFYFQKFYNRFENKILFKLIIFLMRYCENWIRYIKIIIWKLKGRYVFIDRYPKWELITGITDSKINKFLYYTFYKYFFPKPDIIIILDLETKKIIDRKKELTKNEIDSIRKKIKINVGKIKESYILKNEKLDDTLNNILKIIMK